MKVIGFDPFLSAERAGELGIEGVSTLDDLLGRCDYITLHTTLSPETRNLIGGRELGLMKPGVRLINCARGGLIDEPALARAIAEGKVAGAAIDVFDPEPPPADHPLIGLPQVLVTPHLGASTEEAQIGVAVEAARLLIDFFGRGQIRFAVNMPTLDKAELEDLRLYLDLGRRLGMLHAQMDRGAAEGATLALSGRGRGQEYPAHHRELRRRVDGVGPGTARQFGQCRSLGQGARDRDRRGDDDRHGRLRHAHPGGGRHRAARRMWPRGRSSASNSCDS